jgi:uncharacterized membrane protein
MTDSDPTAQLSPGAQAQPEPHSAGADEKAAKRKDAYNKLPEALRHHPAVLEQRAQRAQSFQLRIADWITGFAGSMNFVYLHIALFALWMLFIEKSPWPTLTLIVSLEAIFLSTFVMIGQNRQAAFQQAKADRDFTEQELELKTNTQLTREIDKLTTELHNRLLKKSPRPES